MITEKDLQEAIAECQGVRNPNSSTCIKLAAFLIIKREMFNDSKVTQHTTIDTPEYSYTPQAGGIQYDSGSEFSDTIHGKEPDAVWPIIDELMEALMVVNPTLYKSALRKLTGWE